MKLWEKPFGEFQGKPVTLYHLEASDGAYAEILTYGAIIRTICVPDKNGVLGEVIGGVENAEELFTRRGACSAIVIGRFANRIAGAGYDYKGRHYSLESNPRSSRPMTMHGGSGNYSSKLFDGSAQCDGEEAKVLLRYHDDGQGGFPGEMEVQVTYTFTEQHQLFLDYDLLPSEDTPFSVTNHCYFNLAGRHGKVIDNLLLKIHADFFTPNDADTVPTGEIRPVEGTPFDFRDHKAMGEALSCDYEQLNLFGGFDHNFCIRGRGYRPFVEAKDPESGRKLTVMSDMPGMQFYTCNHRPDLNNEHRFFCFETQNYPNSPNIGHFPSPFLPGGKPFHSRTAFLFSIEK